jgi:hypothetical protein
MPLTLTRILETFQKKPQSQDLGNPCGLMPVCRIAALHATAARPNPCCSKPAGDFCAVHQEEFEFSAKRNYGGVGV